MPKLPLINVSCTSSSDTILQKARALAKKLGLDFSEQKQCMNKYILTFTEEHLELRVNDTLENSKEKHSPLFIDFIYGSAGYRHARNCTIKQPLARAVGIKPGFRPNVFDATAGLGNDGFVLACLGSHVILNERSPILGSLLEDAIARGIESDNAASEILQKRITLLLGDAKNNLQSLSEPPYTVYLDPMYPHSKKSALNKKEMRMIRDIVGDDDDAAELLETALRYARNRVVVKRPKGAERLNNRRPSHVIDMKNSRFDVYMINNISSE